MQEFTKICITNIIKNWGETIRGEMVLGAKRLGCGGESAKGENRSETTLGGTTWGEIYLFYLSSDTDYALASIFGRVLSRSMCMHNFITIFHSV